MYGYPTEKAKTNEPIILLDSNMLQYSDYFQSKLKPKIQFVPFSFKILDSLVFNYQYQNYEEGRVIESYSEQIEVLMQIKQNKAQFCKIDFQGVLFSYFENDTQILLQGNLARINQILFLVKLQLKEQNDRDVTIYTQIDDGLNKKIQTTKTLKELEFLKVNQNVKNGKSIQEQFNGQFENGEVYLEEEVQFSFNFDSFIDDDKNLQYSFYVYQKGQYQEIEQLTKFTYLQINFEVTSRQFKLFCNREMWHSKINILIKASDGYSESEQELEIKPNLVPFKIMIYVIIIVGSTMVSVLGFLQYRGQIHNVVCKKKYQYGKYFMYENEPFMFQISLCREQCFEANIQFQHIIKELKQSNNPQNIQDFIGMGDEFQIDKEKITKIIQDLKQDKKYRDFQSDKSLQFCILKSMLYRQVLSQQVLTKQMYSDLQKYALNKEKHLNQNRWYEYFVEVKSTKISKDNEGVPRVFFNQKRLIQGVLYILKKDSDKIKKFIDISNNDCYELENQEFRKMIRDVEREEDIKNLFLILENMRADAWGYKAYQRLSYSHGQCVLKRPQQIQCIKVLEKRVSIFNPIYQLLNMDYTAIPIGKNKYLPKWMDYNCHNNVMEIYGELPVSKEHYMQKDIVIRIIDIQDFICREFVISKGNKDVEKFNLVGYKSDWEEDEEEEVDRIQMSTVSGQDRAYNIASSTYSQFVKQKRQKNQSIYSSNGNEDQDLLSQGSPSPTKPSYSTRFSNKDSCQYATEGDDLNLQTHGQQDTEENLWEQQVPIDPASQFDDNKKISQVRRNK